MSKCILLLRNFHNLSVLLFLFNSVILAALDEEIDVII